MIKTYSLICPNCGATLEASSDREQMFCEHCGTKILLKDDSVKTINLKSDTIERLAEQRAIRKEEQRKREEVEGKKIFIGSLVIFLLCTLYFVLREYGVI